MSRVGIVVGHTPTVIDGGAYNNTFGMSEFDYNNRLAPVLAEKLRILGYTPVIIYRDTYSSLPALINDILGRDSIALSLHCNAANGKPNGAETLYWHTSTKSRKLAECILGEIVGALGERDRGIKPVGNGGRGASVMRDTVMPLTLIESFFIDSDKSLGNGLDKIVPLADAIAKGVHEYFTS